MINLGILHSKPYLKALTFTAVLAVSSHSCHAADAVEAALGADLERSFVVAILAPMSNLVQSPYVDPTVLENPLGLTTSSATSRHAMHSAVAENQDVLNPHTIDGLTSVIESVPPKFVAIPLEYADNSIEISTASHMHSAGSPASLAMMAR